MRIKEYLLLLTKPELELLIDLCNFSEEESEILTMLSKNNSLIEIRENTKLSVSTVKRRILKIRKKVERVIEELRSAGFKDAAEFIDKKVV